MQGTFWTKINQYSMLVVNNENVYGDLHCDMLWKVFISGNVSNYFSLSSAIFSVLSGSNNRFCRDFCMCVYFFFLI